MVSAGDIDSRVGAEQASGIGDRRAASADMLGEDGIGIGRDGSVVVLDVS